MAKTLFDTKIDIVDLEFPNKGVGYFGEENKKVTVKNTIPGQTVIADVKKKRKNFEGRLRSIEKKAEYEIEPACKNFGLCGGCTYQNISYEQELEFKKNVVLKLLDNAGLTDYEYCGIKPSPSITAYRNKMEFSFGDDGLDGNLCLGMRKRESNYEVVTADCCNIVNEDVCKALSTVLEYFKGTDEQFYHRMRHTGSLRHLLVRRGHFTGEMIINLVTTSELKTDLKPLVDNLLALELDGKIVGISHIVNDGVADVVKADEMNILYGQDFIMDKCLGLNFKISTFSFFQTNSLGAEVLYSKAREYVGSTNDKMIFDLYSGTGTIAQILAPVAKKVVGVEIVAEAVEAAKENAELNGLNNCEFIAGDVLKVIDDIKDKPDLIVLDPPRDGIHPKALQKIIDFGVDRIVYISCKPTSLARDLVILQEHGYKVEKACAVDMFPQTVHVETVCLLSKLKQKPDDYINVTIELDDVYITSAETKATYDEIKKYVAERNAGIEAF